jgi:FSR family fosmidomycin resistance protein-like MFS transporter
MGFHPGHCSVCTRLALRGIGGTAVLSVIIGFMLASSFPAMIVYAQELIPGKVGTVSGLFFGLAFGFGGIGAAVLGQFADLWEILAIYKLCSFLPRIGLLAVFLPEPPVSTRMLGNPSHQVHRN